MEMSLVMPPRVCSRASSVEHNFVRHDDYLTMNDSAFCALTDFRREYPITVNADRSIDDALTDMVRASVHALLVTQEDPDCSDLHVLGLITAYDIEREKAHRIPIPIPYRMPTVKIADLMTPWDELSLINYESLYSLTTGDLHDMFQRTALTHLLVINIRSDDSGVARGLLWRTNLSKRLRNDQCRLRAC
jgi:CBS domain-containing protein